MRYGVYLNTVLIKCVLKNFVGPIIISHQHLQKEFIKMEFCLYKKNLINHQHWGVININFLRIFEEKLALEIGQYRDSFKLIHTRLHLSLP